MSYAMIKEWREPALVKAHQAVVAILWKEKIIPKGWNKKMANPKAKGRPGGSHPSGAPTPS